MQGCLSNAAAGAKEGWNGVEKRRQGRGGMIRTQMAEGVIQDWDAVRAPLHESLLGVSTVMREINDLIHRLAKSSLTVLITGESGTGKDIAARRLHKLSDRSSKPFVKVNCPAIPESILESDLFGYEQGAFTGARTSKPGRLELANHGTIFLDEIGETSHAVQGKLFQVLDGEPFLRIGGVTPIHVDVRVLAASNTPLEEAVRLGRVREDVFFRLSESVVHLPPLRERPEDIPLLAEHFNYHYCKRFEKVYQPIPEPLVDKMQNLPWRGNVRELAACVKMYVATGEPSALYEGEPESAARPAPLVTSVGPKQSEPLPSRGGERRFVPLREAVRKAVESTERSLIEEVLGYTLWNRRKAAKLLGISYSSLLRRIEAYEIGKTESE